MNVQLRAATPSDAAALAALETELFGPDAWSLALVTAELENPGSRIVVAEQGGLVVGYASTRRTGDVVDLLRIGVVPALRRSGLATQLLGRAEEEARGGFAQAVMLEVSTANEIALAFYTARGFTQVDLRPGYYKDGADALVLRKECV